MNKRLCDALEVGLESLETGADIGSVLNHFPEVKNELAPLLVASQQARVLAIPEIPQTVLLRNRALVLHHVAGMRESNARTRWRSPILIFPRLAISLMIASIFLLSGTGLVRASTRALPGDDLYPVKRKLEDVRLLLAFTPGSREELAMQFEGNRLEEVDELLTEKRLAMISFGGLVTQQNGDQWVVSGISVEITPDSQLPLDPVTIGTSIKVEGHTGEQGFVEVDRIEILGSKLPFPSNFPKDTEDTGSIQNFGMENETMNQPVSDNKDSNNEDRYKSTTREGSSTEDDSENYQWSDDVSKYDKNKEDSYRYNKDGYSERRDGEKEYKEEH